MRYITIGLLLFVCRAAASQSLELAGFLSRHGQGALIVLTDQSDKVSSPWLEEGQTWRDFRIAKVDLDGSFVVLSKAGANTTLYLKDSRVKDGGASRGATFRLLKGDVTKKEGRAVYSADAILQVGPYKVSARGGNMESEGSWVVGELTIEAATGATLPAGSVEFKNGKVVIHANKVTLPVTDQPTDSPPAKSP